MFTRKSLLVSALVLSLAVTAPASLSLAKGEKGGHSGGKGKGPKYKGGRTDPKDHTDSEHGVEEDVFHGKHGARWSDDWKGGKDGHGDDHASEDLLDEEDGHDHH